MLVLAAFVLFCVSFHMSATCSKLGAQTLLSNHIHSPIRAFQWLDDTRGGEKLAVGGGTRKENESVSMISRSHPCHLSGNHMKELKYPYETGLCFKLRTGAHEKVKLLKDQYTAQGERDRASFETYRLPGVTVEDYADGSQSLRGASRQLLSSLGIPPVKSSWDRPTYPTGRPRYGWGAYRNPIPHSYPTVEEIRTFLGKLQGLRPLVPAPWQDVITISPDRATTEIIRGSILALFLIKFYDAWVQTLNKEASFQLRLSVPLEALLNNALREQEDLLFRFFWYFARLYPLQSLTVVLPRATYS